jgi:hydroxyacylglutathione hydrolase
MHYDDSLMVEKGDGSLICGDFLYNFFGEPRLEVCDNLADFNTSVEKLKNYEINTFYPGHGKPFTMEQFLKKY